MESQKIKEKLLKTNCFEDNEYLNKYCELIINNLSTKKEKHKTNSHHILQRSYFKYIKEQTDDSFNNKVNLTHYNHILAH